MANKRTAFISSTESDIEAFRKKHSSVIFDLIKKRHGKAIYKTDQWEKGMENILGNPLDPKHNVGSSIKICNKNKVISNIDFDLVDLFWKIKYTFEDNTYLYEDQI